MRNPLMAVVMAGLLTACGGGDSQAPTSDTAIGTQAKGGKNDSASQCEATAAANAGYECALASNLNGDVTWSLDNAPEGMRIQEASGVLKWTPTTAQRGAVSVRAVATSGNRTQRIDFDIDVSGGSADPDGLYVSPTGNDGNAGSVNAPFATLQRAVDSVQPGQTIYVRGGEYRNAEYGQSYANRSEQALVRIASSGTASAPITLRNFGNEYVRLVSDVNGIQFNNQTNEHWIFEGMELMGNAQQLSEQIAVDNWWNDDGIRPMQGSGIGGKTDHITIRNMIVRDFPGAGIRPRDSEYVTIEDNIVYNNAWWSTAGTHGITVSSMKPTVSDNEQTIRVTGNMAFNNQSLVISHVFSKGKVSLVLDEGNGIHLQNNIETFQRAALVENNVIFWNGKAGIGINTMDKLTIRRNAFYQNARVVNRNGEASVQSSALADVSGNLFQPRSTQQTYRDFQDAYIGVGTNYTLEGIAGDSGLPASFIRVAQVFVNPDSQNFRPADGIPNGYGVQSDVISRMRDKIAEYSIVIAESTLPYEEATYLQSQKERIFALWPATWSNIVLEDKATGHTWTYAQRCHYPTWPAAADCS